MARASSTSRQTKAANETNGANLGFEQKMWQAADKLRGHMDAAEYKHVVLVSISLQAPPPMSLPLGAI